MRLIAGLDFETTGFDPLVDEIIEVGCVLWDCDRKKPMEIVSGLMIPVKPIPEVITKITGITNDDEDLFGIAGPQLMIETEKLITKASHIMVHNHPFDEDFRRQYYLTKGLVYSPRPIIDTMVDLPFEADSRKLKYMAADHGFTNPFAHRAVFDVLTMLKIASNYDIGELILRAAMPTLTVVAQVNFDNRQKAKDAGFGWDSEKKIWYRKMKQIDIKEGVWPFAVKVLV